MRLGASCALGGWRSNIYRCDQLKMLIITLSGRTARPPSPRPRATPDMDAPAAGSPIPPPGSHGRGPRAHHRNPQNNNTPGRSNLSGSPPHPLPSAGCRVGEGEGAGRPGRSGGVGVEMVVIVTVKGGRSSVQMLWWLRGPGRCIASQSETTVVGHPPGGLCHAANPGNPWRALVCSHQ